MKKIRIAFGCDYLDISSGKFSAMHEMELSDFSDDIIYTLIKSVAENLDPKSIHMFKNEPPVFIDLFIKSLSSSLNNSLGEDYIIVRKDDLCNSVSSYVLSRLRKYEPDDFVDDIEEIEKEYTITEEEITRFEGIVPCEI